MMTKQEFDKYRDSAGFYCALEELNKVCSDICSIDELHDYEIMLLSSNSDMDNNRAVQMVITRLNTPYSKYYLFNLNDNEDKLPKPILNYNDIEHLLK